VDCRQTEGGAVPPSAPFHNGATSPLPVLRSSISVTLVSPHSPRIGRHIQRSFRGFSRIRVQHRIRVNNDHSPRTSKAASGPDKDVWPIRDSFTIVYDSLCGAHSEAKLGRQPAASLPTQMLFQEYLRQSKDHPCCGLLPALSERYPGTWNPRAPV
jgi:hypothetical protein